MRRGLAGGRVGLVAAALAAWGGSGCDRPAAGGAAAAVAVSSSYLEAVVQDLLPGQPVLRLAEPGMCPGHFDLRPSQIEALRHCRLLLRFDFQAALDAKLAPGAGAGARVAAVTLPGGMGEPASYLAACRQAAAALVERGLLAPAQAEARLRAIGPRVEAEAARLRRLVQAAGLIGCPVVSSVHQEALCRFLGLDVVATFGAADSTSMGALDTAIRAGGAARLVIANRPEGRRLADALAERLGAAVVVFDNFPDPERHGGRFDGLLRDNVLRLIEAAGR